MIRLALLLLLAGCASNSPEFEGNRKSPLMQWTENGWMPYKFAPREQVRDRTFEAALEADTRP